MYAYACIKNCMHMHRNMRHMHGFVHKNRWKLREMYAWICTYAQIRAYLMHRSMHTLCTDSCILYAQIHAYFMHRFVHTLCTDSCILYAQIHAYFMHRFMHTLSTDSCIMHALICAYIYKKCLKTLDISLTLCKQPPV